MGIGSFHWNCHGRGAEEDYEQLELRVKRGQIVE